MLEYNQDKGTETYKPKKGKENESTVQNNMENYERKLNSNG